MNNEKPKKRISKKCGDFPDKWEDWHFRLPEEKNQLRIIDLYRKSGCRSKSEFARARLLGESFKVITIGVNYNQLVRILYITERLQIFESILKEICCLTKELHDLQKQAVELTNEFRWR